MTSSTRLVVVDGHALLYRAYFAYKSLKTSLSMPSGAFYGFLRSVVTLRQRFSQDHMAFVFDHGLCWRHAEMPNYKHASKKEPRLDFLAQLTDLMHFLSLLDIGPILQEPGLEADDIISVLVQNWLGYKRQHTAIIVSSDRDFFQLVSGRVMLYDDRQKRFFGPPEVEKSTGVPPHQYITWKALVGDPADNLPGVIGYGKIKAAKIAAAITGHSLTLTSDQIPIFNRNIRLMMLPKSIHELHIDQQYREAMAILVHGWLVRWTMGQSLPGSTYADQEARGLLSRYECHSLRLEDFFPVEGDMRHVTVHR